MTTIINTRLGPLSSHTVVEAYCSFRKRLAANDVSDLNADSIEEAGHDAFVGVIRSGPALTAWHLVLELLHTSSDADLAFYAAGPLEDLVHLRGGELVGEIESEASLDSRFYWALGCIWLSQGELPDEILARVVRASGNEIEPLPPLADLEV
jgi:hypothetical protein